MADHQVSPAADQRPSRYRSVRKAETAAVAASPPSAQAENIGRSRSRYHHNRPTTAQAQQPFPQSPPIAQAQYQTAPSQEGVPSRTRSTQDSLSSTYNGRHAQRPDAAPIARDSHSDVPVSSAEEPAVDDQREREREQDRKRQQKYDRTYPTDPIRSAERYGDPPQTIRAKPEPRNPNKNIDDSGSDLDSSGGCFGIFKKKKPSMTALSEKNTSARVPASKNGEPLTIRPGGGGVVPGTDAPVSAVNAGDRRVLVECNKSSMYFPITPETTPTDLIQSAANVMSETIDVRSSVLMEHFSTVGVQRPLRRYEHVRDVMNSWNDDRANSLILVSSRAAEVNPAALGASSVPTAKPVECTFLMSYSQKPGSWDKRQITIRSDGQIVMTKNPKDKDPSNICHLSDYDIYTPTAKQLTRKIKPPKRICFAIKSQQKTSMFESRSNYVHFFSTNDRAMGESFYDAVQGWRSWYLVNIMGEGKKQSKQTDLVHSPSRVSPRKEQANHTHHPSTSTIESHYQLGSYKPLLDIDQFDRRPISSHSQNNQGMSQIPSRKLSTRDRSHPHAPHPKAILADDEPLINIATNRSLDPVAKPEPDTFASQGLLGRSYSTRQRQQAEREEASKSAFMSGPSLLNDTSHVARQTSIKRNTSTRRPSAPTAGPVGDLRRGASVRDRNHGSVDLGRSTSVRNGPREMPKPLVDLTPKYKPPPQHVKKGRGHYPDQVGPGGLIDAATSPDAPPIAIPPQHDWRGRVAGQHDSRPRSRSRSNAAAHPPGSSSAGGNGRHYSPAGQPSSSRGREGSASASGSADEPAFTGGGLLASSSHGYGALGAGGSGGGAKGRDGPRNVSSGMASAQGGPLLDVSEASRYAPGSLLAKVEREEGRGGPVVDREA
ncbi:hypothetical protein MBLNU459_g1505t1 [Dothideomycetes sp. NU459]